MVSKDQLFPWDYRLLLVSGLVWFGFRFGFRFGKQVSLSNIRWSGDVEIG